ncbi:unnamed protein product [Triticum turgidum subsp. durum]|uniref:Cryptochrome 1b n=1 Tax=Triticum turgidum subsp. durum TaxID=4567 RepID=A0A9R1AZX8_TRITD|nr:unnamed protein product [Triticum turgidum subsp. durum]
MFTPFWNTCLCMVDPPAPMLPPKRINSGELSRCCSSDDLIFEDESERGSNALLARAWSPGWQNADKAFTAFINGPLIDYSVNRKKADSANTSLLSPYLHFGELSVRKVFHQVRMKQLTWSNESNGDGEEGCSLFLRSIGLREYSRYLAFNHPCSHEKPLLAHLRFFPWVVNEVYFKVWRQGRTGYPLVDAGMRELWATGWLHDRIRVVVSSFFVKVLQLPWRWGMKYFWDTLLDADLESDALGWQYISGSLPDGRELDRIDNPQRLPTEWIHHPWDAPESVLQAAGIELGSNYPLPIVELDEAKSRLQNGMEEGLGDSSDEPPIAFPQELQHMEVDRATIHTPAMAGRRRADQMVPSITSSFFRAETETELSAAFESEVTRPEVPSQVHFQPQTRMEVRDEVASDDTAARYNGVQQQQQYTLHRHRVQGGIAPSTSEASSSWTGREGGVVPVWSPPAASGHSDPYAADETDISSRSYLDRHPQQSHRLMNWNQLSQSS